MEQQEKNKEESANGRVPQNELSYKKEIQIAILAIVAGLGFFKVDDLKAFIDVLAELVIKDIDTKLNHDLSVYLFSGIAALAYLVYFLAFGYALLQMFQGVKNITKTILVSVACYFIMYFFLVMLIFKRPGFANRNSQNKVDTSGLAESPRAIIKDTNAVKVPGKP